MPAAKPLAAEAETALRELAAQLKQSEITPAVAALQLLGELGLDDDFEDLEASIVEEIRVASEKAESNLGDNVKYVAAVKSMERRWDIFLALYHIETDEPTLEMVKLFTAFMYTHRQRASRTGKRGLGDSMAEMTEYILAQVSVLLHSNRTARANVAFCKREQRRDAIMPRGRLACGGLRAHVVDYC